MERSGGVLDEEEPVHCTQLVPVEMWEAILDKVESLSELSCCYRTCKTWQTILIPRLKPMIAFHKVIPNLWPYFDLGDGIPRTGEYQELLKCRLVCRSWKETIDSTIIQEEWDWEDKCIRDIYASLRWPNCTIQGTKVCTPSRDAFLRFLMSTSPPRGNPFPSRTLQIKSKAEELFLHDYSPERRCFFPGEQVHNLLIHTTGQLALKDVREGFLSCLFNQFPNVRRLKLIFDIPSSRYFNHNGPYKTPKVSKEASDSTKNDGAAHVELTCLSELTLVFSPGQPMPLPHIMSSIVLCSPRLRKVTLVMGDIDSKGEDEHRQNLATVLSTVFKADLKELVLIRWEGSVNLSEFIIVPRNPPPSLKRLTLRFRSIARVEVVGLLNVFRLLLQTFSRSLEELRLQMPESLCRDHSHRLRAQEEKWDRTCPCNEYFDEPESNREKLEFRQFCELSGYERLRILGTDHALLHPSIFPAVMRACPTLKELWIHHYLEQSLWYGAEGAKTENVLRRTVAELWADSPPSLRLITVVAKSGIIRQRMYRFPRRSFEECCRSS